MKLVPGYTSTDRSQLGRRDAFHCPCVLVECNEAVSPGQDVMFAEGDSKRVCPCNTASRQAIVDPFLTDLINPGTLFWVMVVPDLIGELTHSFDIRGVEENERVDEEDIKSTPELFAGDPDYDEEEEDSGDPCDYMGC